MRGQSPGRELKGEEQAAQPEAEPGTQQAACPAVGRAQLSTALPPTHLTTTAVEQQLERTQSLPFPPGATGHC